MFIFRRLLKDLTNKRYDQHNLPNISFRVYFLLISPFQYQLLLTKKHRTKVQQQQQQQLQQQQN